MYKICRYHKAYNSCDSDRYDVIAEVEKPCEVHEAVRDIIMEGACKLCELKVLHEVDLNVDIDVKIKERIQFAT